MFPLKKWSIFVKITGEFLNPRKCKSDNKFKIDGESGLESNNQHCSTVNYQKGWKKYSILGQI